jgi:hypothetical protein
MSGGRSEDLRYTSHDEVSGGNAVVVQDFNPAALEKKCLR